jgi:hypothetical protein
MTVASVLLQILDIVMMWLLALLLIVVRNKSITKHVLTATWPLKSPILFCISISWPLGWRHNTWQSRHNHNGNS